MQISRFTDLGLKVLIYLSYHNMPSTTIARIADDLQVSKNHLVKVVHFMGQQQWLVTMRGKYGGIALARLPQEYFLGELIRHLEKKYQQESMQMRLSEVECGVLPMLHCLPEVFQESLEMFYQSLNRYNLADLNPAQYNGLRLRA
ncbi:MULTISPECIES: RrF2 family transcriptional regulator [Vitreoscilla]|uniref:Rrf2 family transcriptional regulator n=1 Tax=Vitreoscilla stercoraria TaxID=61 RepID=A0ABY4EA18_VITST|nr:MULTISPECIES: Rrf2 family transcriptional regulator [Vitreoscilla]AUZ03919.1 transcriptional regulator Rrf2-like protein [Vitreoscilla sp. C1]UOO92158.1 Rrf2 family transcriptional regulator [Vitreoscilla stercoraria]